MKMIAIALVTVVLAAGTAVRPAPADPIPTFSVQLLDEDRALTDADLRGVFTLISFWATNCGPCVRELPNLEAAHARYGDRIEMLSISRDRDAETVQAFRRDRHAMPWRNAVVGPDSEVFEAFGVRGTPHTILVAPDGRIVARTRDLLGERLMTTLDRLVAGCGA